ncbi:MAG: aminotransferase class III-fold pyridoxal phosphate-dependent enzyme, partial [Jiangellaceae bacterium]
RAPVIGRRLSAGLRDVAEWGLVAEARGDGAVWAMGMHPGVSAVAVRDAMLERGVIVRAIGEATLSFCPPLVITEEQVDACVQALDGALQEVRAG